MGGVICIVITAFVFLVVSIALFFGKGSWLIAGFNTASADEKASFDKKKLCRAAGSLCLVVSLLLGAMAFLGYKVETGVLPESGMVLFGIVFAAAVLSMLIFVIRFMNTRCKK